jgi:hypothetical protein
MLGGARQKVGQFSPSPSLFLSSSPSLVPLSSLQICSRPVLLWQWRVQIWPRRARSDDGKSRSGHGGEPRAGCDSLDATTADLIGLHGGLARAFFKTINEGRHPDTRASVNGLTEVGEATASVIHRLTVTFRLRQLHCSPPLIQKARLQKVFYSSGIRQMFFCKLKIPYLRELYIVKCNDFTFLLGCTTKNIHKETLYINCFISF